MARHNEIGRIGEDIATQWLKKSGFSIVDRNYNRKWGEIDIVARLPAQSGGTNGEIHFVEVKSVSYETRMELNLAVSRGTWRPEENVHKNKQDRLKRAIQTWLLEAHYAGKWQIDVVTIRMVPREKHAKVKMLENVVFE